MIDPDITIKDYVAVYAAHNLNITASSAAIMGFSVASLTKLVGPLRVADLTDEIVVSWLKHRLSKVSRKTVKRDRGAVLTLWRDAYRRKICPVPPGDIPTIKVPRTLPVAYRLEEAQAIMRAAVRLDGLILRTRIKRKDWWLSLLLFLYDTAARPGAVLQMAPADIDLAARTARLRAETSKTGLEQIIRFSEQTADVLRRHYSQSRSRIWPWPYGRRHLFTEYKRLLVQAGVAGDRSHGMYAWRRTCATAVAKVAGIASASRQLGHTSEAMTRRYIDPTLLGDSSAVDVLPRPKLD